VGHLLNSHKILRDICNSTLVHEIWDVNCVNFLATELTSSAYLGEEVV
jgi:hypothetical protein